MIWLLLTLMTLIWVGMATAVMYARGLARERARADAGERTRTSKGLWPSGT